MPRRIVTLIGSPERMVEAIRATLEAIYTKRKQEFLRKAAEDGMTLDQFAAVAVLANLIGACAPEGEFPVEPYEG